MYENSNSQTIIIIRMRNNKNTYTRKAHKKEYQNKNQLQDRMKDYIKRVNTKI